MKSKTLSVLTSALSLVAITGCTKKPAEPVQQSTPLIIDRATQIRDWDRSTVYYANGDTVSPAERSPLVAPTTGVPIVDPLLEPFAAFGNAVYLPFSYIVSPPGSRSTSTGVQLDPTYTAVQPLAPASAYQAEDQSGAPTGEPNRVNSPTNANDGMDTPPSDSRTGAPLDNSGRPNSPSRSTGTPSVNPQGLTPGSPSGKSGAGSGTSGAGGGATGGSSSGGTGTGGASGGGR